MPLRAKIDAVIVPTDTRGKAVAEAGRLENLGKQRLTTRQRLEQAAKAPVPESAQEFQGKVARVDAVSKTLGKYAKPTLPAVPDATAAETQSRLDGCATLMKSAEIYRMMPPDGLDDTTPTGQAEIKKIAEYVGVPIATGTTARPDADIKNDIMVLANGGMASLRASGIGQLLLSEYNGDQVVADAVLESLMRDSAFRESLHEQVTDILSNSANLEIPPVYGSSATSKTLDGAKVSLLNDKAYHVGNNSLYKVLDTNLKAVDAGMERELAKTENAGRDLVNKRWRESETNDTYVVRENLSADVRTTTDLRQGDLGLRAVVGRSLGVNGIDAIATQEAYDALDDKTRAQIEGIYRTHGTQIKADLWVNLSKNIGLRDKFKFWGGDLHFSDKEWEQNAEYFSSVSEQIVQGNPQARALLKKVERSGMRMSMKKKLGIIALITLLAVTGGYALAGIGPALLLGASGGVAAVGETNIPEGVGHFLNS